MGIFADDLNRMQQTFFEVLHLCIGMQTDLHFIPHPIDLDQHQCRAFINKISFQIGYHGAKIRETGGKEEGERQKVKGRGQNE
ncbi:hypothetical protein D9M68_937790 [compost metagenome]